MVRVAAAVEEAYKNATAETVHKRIQIRCNQPGIGTGPYDIRSIAKPGDQLPIC